MMGANCRTNVVLVRMKEMLYIFCMHSLLEAIVFLCETLLSPFTQSSSAKREKSWIVIVGTLIAVTGLFALVGLAALFFL